LIGTIWSSPPCTISVGTSIFFKSSVKSVSENALDAVVGVLVAGHHALHPEGIDQALRYLRTGRLKPKKGPEAMSLYSCERSAMEAARMPSKNSSSKPSGLASVFSISGGTAPTSTALATRSGTSLVTRDLTAASRVADQHGILQTRFFDQFRQIVGVLIHVVAIPRLVGTSMPATVMSDDAIAVGGEEQHLRFPRVRAEGSAMAEDD
jgi:hypothetical protein